MKEIKAPGKVEFDKFSIFLAGSIEMGKAEDWQSKFAKAMSKHDVQILNPRRDDWDSSWSQTLGDKQFVEQVSWELNCQEKADLIVMYFDPETKSPITLLELGLFAKSGKIVVCCPDKFYRSGNVSVTCQMYNVSQVSTLEELIEVAKIKYLSK